MYAEIQTSNDEHTITKEKLKGLSARTSDTFTSNAILIRPVDSSNRAYKIPLLRVNQEIPAEPYISSVEKCLKGYLEFDNDALR